MVEPVTPGSCDFAWQKSPLFRFCDAADWSVFLTYVSVCDLPAGSVLWSEGEKSCQLICVVSGSLEAVKHTPDWGKPIIVAQYYAGASVGEQVFGDDCGHSTTLHVLESASLLVLDESRAESLQRDEPAVVSRLLRGSTCLQLERLRSLNRRLATLF
jgi:CRP-like cAMP-binding protein